MQSYFQQKSSLLLQLGIEAYRKQDFYKHPPSNLTAEELNGLYDGAEQIIIGKGFVHSSPIVNIALNHIVLLAHCFHFEEGRWKGQMFNDTWTDEIPLCHVLSGDRTTLYLESKTGMDRSRKNRRVGIFQKIGPDYLPALSYAPQLIMSELVETGKVGDYGYSIHERCQAEGSIEYRYVLYCYALSMKEPCLAITAEVSTYDPRLLLLCAFMNGQHKNYGSRHNLSSIEDFTSIALQKVKSIIGYEEP